MRLKSVMSLIGLTVCFSLLGQKESNVNVLLRHLKSDSNSDTTLINILEYYKSENLDSLNYYAKQFVKYSDPSLKVTIALIRIEAYIIFNDHVRAQSLFDSLGDLNTQSPQIHIRWMLMNGRLLKNERKFDQALKLFYNALEEANTNNALSMLPELYADIAYILSQNNDLVSSTKYYKYALQDATKSKNIKLQVKVCYDLCRLYNGGITVNLDSSVYYGELGLKLALEAKYEYGYATMLSIVAAPIIRQGHYRKGLLMSQNAKYYMIKYNFNDQAIYYQILNEGFAYEKIGLYDSAILKLREGAMLRPQGADHHRLEYLIYKSKGDYKKSLAAHEIYLVKRDSIIEGRNSSKLSELQARQEANIKEQEVNDLSQQSVIQNLKIRQKNQMILIGIAIFIIVIIVIYLIHRQRSIQKEKIQNSLEQRFLRSQLNPHFIFNALMAIQNFMMKNDAQQASIYLVKFSKLMRVILENSREEFIPIASEIEMLKNYLDIHKLRLNDSFDYQIVMDEYIEDEVDTIPPMFVQPFVENAIEHGIITANGRGLIELNFTKQDEYISIQISDNGGGMSVGKITSSNHKSLATTIIQERMTLFNKSLKDKIQLIINDIRNETGEVQGTRVELRVPYSYI